MAIEVESVRDGPYFPNGVTVSFPYSFKANSTDDVRVFTVLDDVETTINPTTYSVVPNGNDEEGGSIEFDAALLDTVGELFIELDPDWGQPTKFSTSGFLPSALNPPLDRLAQKILVLRDRINRAFILPFSESGEVLSPADDRTDTVMGFGNGGAFELLTSSALANRLLAPLLALIGPGMKGDPGGNAMAVGPFTTVAGLNIPVGTDQIITTGFNTNGWGGARYVYDATVDAAYVAANPLIAKLTSNGRGFRLATDQPLNGFMFGAPLDGSDVGPAIEAAAKFGRPVSFPKPPVGYRVTANRTITLTGEVWLDFEHNQIEFAGGSLTFTGVQVAVGRTLAGAAARYATAVQLNDVTGILAGDLLLIDTTVDAETGWGHNKKDLIKIKSVNAGTGVVELEEPIQFAYAVADAGLAVSAYRPQRATFRGVNGRISAVGGQAMFDLRYLEDVTIEQARGEGTVAFDPPTNELERLFRLLSCWKVTARDSVVRRLSYPFLITAGTRGVLLDGLDAAQCRHAFAPSDWPKGVLVRNLHASDCYQAIDSHPAFDVVVDGFTIERDSSLSNLRCVRGALRNGSYHTLATDAEFGPYYQSLVPGADVAAYLYADADFEFWNIRASAPNRTKSIFSLQKGRFLTVEGLVTDKVDMIETFNTVGTVLWGSRNNMGGRRSPTRKIGGGVRGGGFRTDLPPRLDAYLDTGVYHIDPRREMVDQTNHRVFCRGTIARQVAGTPQTFPIRIHTNAFAALDNPSYIIGRLKLIVTARHSNAGAFVTLSKEFNFFHKAVAVSAVTFPLVATATSTPSGQANENQLSLTIANPTQNGGTELGASGDFWVAIDALVAMLVVTNPIFDLDYELEMVAPQA